MAIENPSQNGCVPIPPDKKRYLAGKREEVHKGLLSRTEIDLRILFVRIIAPIETPVKVGFDVFKAGFESVTELCTEDALNRLRNEKNGRTMGYKSPYGHVTYGGYILPIDEFPQGDKNSGSERYLLLFREANPKGEQRKSMVIQAAADDTAKEYVKETCQPRASMLESRVRPYTEDLITKLTSQGARIIHSSDNEADLPDLAEAIADAMRITDRKNFEKIQQTIAAERTGLTNKFSTEIDSVNPDELDGKDK
jgi:hypothetical protein